jgi:initiation factor 1A
MSRKLVNSAKAPSSLRIVKDRDELYASITKAYGNNMCEALCDDGVKRTCHISGKFRGRNKKDNYAGQGATVLIGLRDYEKTSPDTNDGCKNCDLLYVYREDEKERLKTTCPSVNWRLFTNDHTATTSKSTTDSTTENKRPLNTSSYDGGITDDVAFVDEDTYELQQQLNQVNKSAALAAINQVDKSATICFDDDTIVDFDDI